MSIRTVKKNCQAFVTAVFVFVMSFWAMLIVCPERKTLVDAILYGTAEVHFLDIGQGDCAIIKFPDGKTMLIDAGDNKSAVESKIKSYITDILGADFKYFDYAILTHQDADHCGKFDKILQAYPARVVYRPNVVANNSSYVDAILALTANTSVDANLRLWFPTGKTASDVKKKNTVVYKNFVEATLKINTDFAPKVIVTDGRRGSSRPAGKASQDIIVEGEFGYSFEFYSPLQYTYTNDNDFSPIMRFSYQSINFMMSGDAEKTAEEQFVAAYGAGYAFDADVIKLGHHGSRTSSNEAYLAKVAGSTPRNQIYTVISCGAGNSYGHPHPEVIERLGAMGFSAERFLRTDLQGDIVFSVRKDSSGVYQLYTDSQGAPQQPDGDNGGQSTTPPNAQPFDPMEWFAQLDFQQKLIAVAIVIVVLIVLMYAFKHSTSKSKRKSKKKKRGKKSAKKKKRR